MSYRTHGRSWILVGAIVLAAGCSETPTSPDRSPPTGFDRPVIIDLFVTNESRWDFDLYLDSERASVLIGRVEARSSVAFRIDAASADLDPLMRVRAEAPGMTLHTDYVGSGHGVIELTVDREGDVRLSRGCDWSECRM